MTSYASLALCAATLPAMASVAHAQEPQVERRVALVVYAKGSPDGAMVEAFLAALAEVGERVPSFTLVRERGGGEGNGARAIVACGADIRCIARVGAAAGATHILFCRASEQSDSVVMQWILVDVARARVTGKFRTSPPSVAAARADAAKMLAELLGVTGADMAQRPSGTDPPRKQECASSVPSGAPPSGIDWRSPRAVGTLAAIASGAVFLGVGLYLGQQSRGVHDDAMGGRVPGSAVTRLVADRPRLAVSRNDAVLVLGGLLAAGGCALWVRESMAVSPVIAVGADGGVAGVSVAW